MHEFRAPDGPFHGVWQPERPDVVFLALMSGWGIAGVWTALMALIGVRLVTTAWRFAAGRWVVTGEAH